ncbi:hypothetical protein BDZ89DRAFT_1084278 [Hymenopellis radicata]|nr:hypothetical protein BDZ89DRAFT_1084278 [Hymenopellis radicata]
MRFWEKVPTHHQESLRVLSIIPDCWRASTQWCIDESKLAQLRECKALRTINVAAQMSQKNGVMTALETLRREGVFPDLVSEQITIKWMRPCFSGEYSPLPGVEERH